jgi:hypothetical protein
MAKKFLSDIELDAGLVDVNGNKGTSGQILSSTGTGVDWINQDDITAGEVDKALSLTLQVKNTESVALTKGQVVCAAPTATPPSGNVIEVKLADNNGTDSMPVIGILNEGLDAAGGANDEGEAIMFGRISGINTSAFSVGDEVFVSDTPGGLTATKPTGVKYIQKVGVIMRDDASNGTIEVFGAGRTNDVPTPLYVDHANQRLGIRKTSPSSELHINNDSALPQLTLSNAPVGGYGGGGKIIIEGGTGDYVYGSIEFKNGGSRDATFAYSAASRQMSFIVNERNVATNGYFRFYNVSTKVAEINANGIYGNVFYDQGNTSYYVNPASTGNSFNALGYAHIRGGITTDGSARSYTWRALDNTESSSTRYQKIARITSGQSSRFIIELAGRSTSYGDVSLPAMGYIVGQLNNDNNYDLVFYNHSGEDTVVDEVGQVDVSTTSTDIYIKVSSFSEVTAHAHISDGTIAVDSTSAGSTEPSNYIAATNITVWNSRNDGSGSGLDADLLDGEQADDFVHVTGDTMTGALTASGGINGLTLANGISGSNFNITGVNQLSINDPGEGILFGGGTNNVTLYAIDDSTDNKMNFSGASELQINGSKVFHDGYHPNADTWTTARTITIGSTGKSVNGSADVSWSLSEIGAAASSHTHTWADISGETANSVNSWGGLRHQTNDGYIDFGPANSSYAHIYTDMPSFYLNKSLTVLGGSQINQNDIRAKILYDKDNTSYYVNPNGTSVMSQIYLDNWLVHNGDTNTFMGFADADTIRFVTNNAERMEISNGGVVFGGGAAAAKPVHVATSDQGTARIRIENTNASGDTFDLISGVHNVTQEGFSIYQENANATRLRIDDDGNVKIGSGAPSEKLDVDGSIKSNATIWTGYDSGVVGSVSCSDWFRSSGSSGWFNATYSGGIHMQDSTWVRVYNNKKFYNQNTIESGTAMYAPIFYDRNNTGYFFNGDASKDNVDLVTGSNYAINVLGTISGGHRKHGNLETPEMQFSVGGGTDLNWKKLFDVVTGDASYSGWGAEIEITNFSGNFGSATYSNGELYKGALSVYHWGGTGYTPETPYANIPYDMRSFVRWYKIQESGQNRYQLQVKSVGNYQQLYVKVKPGIGNQVSDIISYSNDTDGATSGGTAYTSTQTANFNHEFAGGIWTNDSRAIGWKNAYGSPYLSSYYGTITTSTGLYVGGPTGNGQDVYCDDLRSNKVFDRAATAYYFEGGNTGDSIRVAGDVVAYYSSDKRLKDNIKPIENALDKVKAISGVTFEWNEKSHKTTGKKDVGVVAQEIEDVLPELVETRTNGYKAVDYQKLTAVLIESVKELTAKVEALEAKQCNCK